jgi:hypothetical protein
MCHAVNCHRIDTQSYKAARLHRSSVIESYDDNSNHRGPVTDAPTEPDRTPPPQTPLPTPTTTKHTPAGAPPSVTTCHVK